MVKRRTDARAGCSQHLPQDSAVADSEDISLFRICCAVHHYLAGFEHHNADKYRRAVRIILPLSAVAQHQTPYQDKTP